MGETESIPYMQIAIDNMQILSQNFHYKSEQYPVGPHRFATQSLEQSVFSLVIAFDNSFFFFGMATMEPITQLANQYKDEFEEFKKQTLTLGDTLTAKVGLPL